MSLALYQVLSRMRTHTHMCTHSSGKLFLLWFGLVQFNKYSSVFSASLGATVGSTDTAPAIMNPTFYSHENIRGLRNASKGTI